MVLYSPAALSKRTEVQKTSGKARKEQRRTVDVRIGLRVVFHFRFDDRFLDVFADHTRYQAGADSSLGRPSTSHLEKTKKKVVGQL